MERFNKSDKQVRKENKRRNIHLDNDIYRDILFNFTPNINFQHIQEIFNGECDPNQLELNNKNSGKSDDTMMTDNYGDLPTFSETYDAMNFNLELNNHDLTLSRNR
jgi:hypothetical protein